MGFGVKGPGASRREATSPACDGLPAATCVAHAPTPATPRFEPSVERLDGVGVKGPGARGERPPAPPTTVWPAACHEFIGEGPSGNKSIESLGILFRSAASLRDASAREVIRNHVDRPTYFATGPER
jgi:hypothetical protein